MAIPQTREQYEQEFRRAYQNERVLPLFEGKILNPATGKLVKPDARVGAQVQAQHARALVEARAVLPRGAYGRAHARAAVAGPIMAEYNASARSRVVGAYREQRYSAPGAAPVTTSEFAKMLAQTVAGVQNARHVNVAFVDDDGFRITRAVHGRTRDDFRNALERLMHAGQLEGSDAIQAGYMLNTAAFDVVSIVAPRGGALKFTGISSARGRAHPHFHLVDFSGKSAPGDCLFAVLRAFVKACGLEAPKARNGSLRERAGIPAGDVEASAVNIAALSEIFGTRIRVITRMAVPADADREFDDNPARLIGRNLCHTIAEPHVLVEAGDEALPCCDVYLADGHYEFISRILEPIKTCPITGDIVLTTDVRPPAAIAARVLAQGRRWYPEQRVEPAAAKAASKFQERIIIYDYETVYRADGTLEPYALGFTVFSPPEAEAAAAAADFAGKAADVTQIIRAEGENGFSVSLPLIELLRAAPADVRYTLVSFNGARFDHFLLAQAANNAGMLTGLFATGGGALRSLTLGGRHMTLDLAKLAPAMSLADACRDFKTSPSKLEGFSHALVQAEHDAGRLYPWLAANREKLAEYLALDVLSEASLFVKLTCALTAVTKQKCYGAKACQTVGAHAWAHMAATCALPKCVADHALDKEIRAAVVGGRVQHYNPAEKHIEADKLFMVDFASLYPTAMAAVDKAAACFAPEEQWGSYPTAGEPEHVEEFIPGAVGAYDVTVHEQPPNLPNVLPKRTEDEPLDWGFRGEFTAKATHIDIHLIRTGGGRVTVHRGLVWRQASTTLFRPYVLGLAALKDEQDQLKEAKDPRFNPALRMVYKLLLNSASGKCCQANYDDCAVLAQGAVNQLAAENKMDPNQPRTWIPIGGETCIIIGKKLEAKVYTKRAKPSILAVLIYSYSRALVWRTICQHNCLYSDTDSGLFREADYHALRARFPALDPAGRTKELGDLEQELKPHARAEAFLIAAKDYAVVLYGLDDKPLPGASKIRAKGVCMGRDRLLTAEGLDTLKDATTQEYTAAYHTSLTTLSTPLKSDSAAVEFFRRRAAGEAVQVLCSQIVRTYKDLAAPLSLTQRFLVKTI